MRVISCCSAVLILAILFGGSSHAANVIFVRDSFPGSSARLAEDLLRRIRGSGFHVEVSDGASLRSRLDVARGPGTILVLPSAVCFPADAKVSLTRFVKRGNHLLAVSGPAFSRMVVRSSGRWITREQIGESLTASQGHDILEFSEREVSSWHRASSSPGNPAIYESVQSGDPRLPVALHAHIGRLDDWELLNRTDLRNPFPPGYSATTFWAKGGPNTPELVVQWVEKDGTRWMGIVRLTTRWKRYALTPADFAFWKDGSPTERGGPGDRFYPENAGTLSFGICNGISKQKLGTAHEYWVAGVQAVRSPFDVVDFRQPLIESISPVYKVYKTTVGRGISTSTGRTLSARTEAICPVSRSRGYGMAVPKWRYIPVVEGYDETGHTMRGSVAHMLLNITGDYAGSVYASVGLGQRFLESRSEEYVPTIVSMLKRIERGIFIASAGADQFAYLDGEQVRTGAYLVNLTGRPVRVTVRTQISHTGAESREHPPVTMTVPPRSVSPTLVSAGAESGLRPGEYRVRVRAFVGKELADEVTQPIQMLRSEPLTGRNTVTVRGGDFYLDGAKWYPFGINYWPMYLVGQEPTENWLYWLSPQQYDPGIVEADLNQMRGLGMNMVSIFYSRLDQSRPLMDFLARCERHGIKANVFVEGLDPGCYDLSVGLPKIRAAHLGENPAVFAYDLGWEVRAGQHDRRKVFDHEWQAWVTDRYGSVESAVTDWSFSPPVADGCITGPTDDQLSKEGDWRVFVAAYRRFWDDKWSKGYQTVRAAIRTLDPHHLMGARSGFGGMGSQWATAHLPIDLRSGAKHLDFISPEGYNLSGDRKSFLRGAFDNEYGRFWSGGMPIFWAEYGQSLFMGTTPESYRMEDSLTNLESERQYFHNLLTMVIETRANGSAGWWWPSGYRVDERSDYGIINQDHTLRPAALEFTRMAAKSKAPRELPNHDCYLTMDRDRHASGYAGVHQELAGKYADLIAAGKYPGLRTEGTGTTSADTPLIAVGNVPCTGHNPPKHLNAEFNRLEINGKPVADHAIVYVEHGQPVTVEASIGNTAEAKWLAPRDGKAGGVYLLALANGVRTLSPISADTPFLSDASVRRFVLTQSIDGEVTYAFRMTAKDRTDFGEVMWVTLCGKTADRRPSAGTTDHRPQTTGVLCGGWVR